MHLIDVSIMTQIIKRHGEGITATDDASSLRGRHVQFAPSDLDKKEHVKKNVVRGRLTLSPQSPNPVIGHLFWSPNLLILVCIMVRLHLGRVIYKS